MPTKEPTPPRDHSWDDASPGETVRKLRFLIDQNHVTVPQLADEVDISKKLLQDVLDGVSLPTESMIRNIAEYFGVTVDFVTGSEEAPPKRPSSRAVPRAVPRPASRAVPRAPSGSGARARSGSSAGSVARPAKSGKGGGALSVRSLATRHQALVELLIEKGVVSARDYHEKVQSVEGRQR